MPPLDVGLDLDALGRAAVDHPQNSAPLLGLSDDHLDRVRSRTEDRTHLRDFPNPAQHIDRIAVAERNHERMSGGDGLRVTSGIGLEIRVISVGPRQACAGGFVERDAELHVRRGVHDRFVEILHCLDEVALADDDVPVGRDFQANRFELHGLLTIIQRVLP